MPEPQPVLKLEVYRWDPRREPRPYFQAYTLPRRRQQTILSLLQEVLEGHDGSLAFRASCREGICGACAALVNGRYRLTCSTLVDDLGAGTVTVAPLPRLRVIKDLVVDLDPFWRAYAAVEPYLLAAAPAGGGEHRQSPAEREAIGAAVACVLCGCCFVACPTHWTGKYGLGPAALNQVFRFYRDSRDSGGPARLRDAAEGLWNCRYAFNCADACPRGINPAHHIRELRREVFRPTRRR